jgi:tetratricopeptide (TPR) repeat protein
MDTRDAVIGPSPQYGNVAVRQLTVRSDFGHDSPVRKSDKSGVDSAQLALDAVQRRPQEAIAIAQRVLAGVGTHGPADERATAERAIGLAMRELNDLPAAVRHLRRSVRLAERGGSLEIAALARMSLGYALASSGRNVAALRAVSTALSSLTGVDAGRARMQRGVVLHYCGRYEDAVRDYTAAVEIAQQQGDLLLEARARNNRGTMQANRGTSGGNDLERSEAIFRELGLELAAADVRWNIGTAAARRGEVAAALRAFGEVEQEYRTLEIPRPALLLDRLELLLSIPLIDEAAAVAAAAVRELDRRGMASDLAEALLGQARVALLAGDLDTVATAATRARRLFHRQDRRAWAALARSVELRADFRRGTRTVGLLAATVRTAALLDETAWPGPALTARIEAAQVAADLGRSGTARDLLVVAGRARRGGTANRRAQGWYATALLRRLDGQDHAASAALHRGLAVLDAHRASLGATELRASSGAHGQDLAAEGLDIAVASGRAAQVLAWAERWRATTLRMAPVSPPRDQALADALAELRVVSAALESATLDGRPAQPQRRRQAHLEHQIRELARQADGGGAVARSPGLRRLADALGRSVLLELVTHRERILAVVLRDGKATMHDLGPLDTALDQTRLQRFALRRLVTRGDSAAAHRALTYTSGILDSQLLLPLRRHIDTRPLVIVPVGQLHALAWSVLPTCAGRPITVAPSSAAWLRAVARIGPDGAAVLVAGPRLPAAEDEVGALAAAQPGLTLLTGAAATADAVMSAMNGAGLAHIAAHGVFRGDNPLLSTIELADGPLTAYELERLSRPPDCVVLSACESGLSAIRPGDELMGFATVLLSVGTRSLIASLLPVPADQTTGLMLQVHERLRAGRGPAQALADAQHSLAVSGDGIARATAAAFMCFGAG